MSLTVALTWLASVAIILVANLVLALRFGYRAGFMPVLLGFIPQIILFPFAYSIENVYAVGPYSYRRILAHLSDAWYFYGLTATVFMISLFVIMNRQAPRRPVKLDFFDRSMTKLLVSDQAAALLLAIQVVLFVILIAAGFRYGAGLYSGFENTRLRPILNAANTLFSLGILVSALRLMLRVSAMRVIVLLITLFMSGLSGQRGIALIPLIVFSMIFMSVRSIRIPIWPALVAILLIPLAIAMGEYRGSAVPTRSAPMVSTTTEQRGVAYKFLYGNQFSDVRELAWVLSGYDGKLLLGKTYAADYTPFIPSAFWSFRREWGYGEWTVRRAGLDPDHHPGLRPGLLSEIYFNFGFIMAVIGSITVGGLVGRLLRHEVRHDADVGDRGRRAGVAMATYYKVAFLLNVIFTPGFFGVPVTIGALLMVDTLVKLRPAAGRLTPRAT